MVIKKTKEIAYLLNLEDRNNCPTSTDIVIVEANWDLNDRR